MRGLVRCFHRPCKSVGKYLALTRGVIALQGLINHVVAALRIGRSIPRPMKGDEHAVVVPSRELLAVVPHHRIRCPMRGKGCNRSALARARTKLLAPVAAVFGSED